MIASVKAFCLHLLGRIIGVLSLRNVQRVGAGLGDIARRLNTRAARTTARNVQLCFPALDQREQATLSRASLRATGMLAAEALVIWSHAPMRSLAWIRQTHGESVLAAGAAAGRGVIVIAPHIGNWELLNAYLGHKYKFVALYAPGEDAALNALLTMQRRRAGGEMLPVTRAGIRTMLRRLKEGRIVGHMPDQVPSCHVGVYAPFFAVPALTSRLIARLAQRSGAAVVCAAALRLPEDRGFEVHIETADALVHAADTETAVRAVNATVERCVRLAPAQYQWEYKRFKHPPFGQPDYYK